MRVARWWTAVAAAKAVVECGGVGCTIDEAAVNNGGIGGDSVGRCGGARYERCVEAAAGSCMKGPAVRRLRAGQWARRRRGRSNVISYKYII